MSSLVIMVVCVLFAENFYAQQSNNDIAISVGTLWESKYVSEGRDNLKEGGLFSLESGFELSNFSFLVWYAISDASNYQELHLSLEYALKFAGFESYIGYTRLEFLKDSESDNEFSAGVVYTKYPWLIPAVDYVYSSEANGSFVEFFLRSNIKLVNDRLTLSPYVKEGLDLGYSTEKHDGLNNFQTGLEVVIPLTKKIELNGYIAYSLAQEDVKRENQDDLTWVGIGVSRLF